MRLSTKGRIFHLNCPDALIVPESLDRFTL
nr:MAG TPA: hypothetical protein [Caudoviricetes sp.]